MWPYWIMFVAPASVALVVERENMRTRLEPWRALGPGLGLYATITFLLTGLRFKVGGDWYNYLGYFEAARYTDFETALSQPRELGYYVLNSLSASFGWDIVGVNLVCAAAFFIGLVALCRQSPRPWLAIAVATPYLVIVVAMGYSRQSVALGFAMLGYVALARGSALRFVVWVLIGAAFHRTALVLLPIAVLASVKNRVWTMAWLSVVGVVAYRLALEPELDRMYQSYVGGEIQSSGALIRLLMNAAPAVLLLTLRGRIGLQPVEEKLWLWISLISIGLLVVYFVQPSASTAIDRVALYFLPIQVVVLSRLPDCFETPTIGGAKFVVGLVLVCYATALYVWLNFAAYAYAWTQYQFYPLSG
jgi:hypothetical protein